eukprot:6447720-Amphidinium_carterae.1
MDARLLLGGGECSKSFLQDLREHRVVLGGFDLFVKRLSVAAGPLEPLLVGGCPACVAGDPGFRA